jgi:uncharacterized protein (DUF2062 family)
LSWLRRRIDRARYLWRLALRENATPSKFAWAVALGVFIGASPVPPVFGMRTVSAGFLAWLGRLNKLTACISVHLLAPITWAVILFEVTLGCRLLGRPAPHWTSSWMGNVRQALGAMLGWSIGSIFVAPVLATAAGLIAYPISKRYLDRRAARERLTPP